ncbi:hypothetical protein BDF19DRAFT_291606 [Syncephalis fuscata]|nr:hypothetical protein BDF19DRAFT_291606 [Syncephalis fuscata]
MAGQNEQEEKGLKRRDWSRRNKRVSDDSLKDQMSGSYDPNNDDEQVSTPLSWTESELDSNASFDPYGDYVDALSPQMAEYPSACVLRVFAGNLPLAPPYKNVVVTDKTTAAAMVRQAVRRFKLEDQQYSDYYISIVTQGSGDYRLNDEDHPIAVLQLVRSQSLATVKRLSGGGMRSSTASISGIIHQMGLTEQDVHDHTGHDDIFRFYLHRHPTTPAADTPRTVSEAIFVKVVAHVINNEHGGVALANEDDRSREIFEVIGVETASTIADLANLAQQQFSLQDTGNFHVILSHNHQNEPMPPNTCVMDVIQDGKRMPFCIKRRQWCLYVSFRCCFITTE